MARTTARVRFGQLSLARTIPTKRLTPCSEMLSERATCRLLSPPHDQPQHLEFTCRQRDRDPPRGRGVRGRLGCRHRPPCQSLRHVEPPGRDVGDRLAQGIRAEVRPVEETVSAIGPRLVERGGRVDQDQHADTVCAQNLGGFVGYGTRDVVGGDDQLAVGESGELVEVRAGMRRRSGVSSERNIPSIP